MSWVIYLYVQVLKVLLWPFVEAIKLFVKTFPKFSLFLLLATTTPFMAKCGYDKVVQEFTPDNEIPEYAYEEYDPTTKKTRYVTWEEAGTKNPYQD